MDSFSVGAVLVLATVFAIAGTAKLLDLKGSQRTVADFGVPAPAASVGGVLLPIAEIATAILLVLHPTARAGAAIAIGLLLAFVAGIANAMRLGRAPDCNCFGQLHSAPAGWRTLVRNAVLAALAAVLVVRGPGPAIGAWASARSAPELTAIGVTVTLLGLAAYAWRLWSENRELRADLAKSRSGQKAELQAEGLPAGSPAPSFALPDVHGQVQTLEGLLEGGRPLALFFMDPTCGPCKGLMPELARWQGSLGERVTIAVITSGNAKQDAGVWQENSICNVLYDHSREAFGAFNLRSTPTAMLVAPSGTIAGGPAGGLHMPEVLLRVTLKRADVGDWPTPASGPQSGFALSEAGYA
jgi:uncharacterized membrane protein YphA (DoxX/SURF4 family)/thiol-disulfide isomerase/thioredoxin